MKKNFRMQLAHRCNCIVLDGRAFKAGRVHSSIVIGSTIVNPAAGNDLDFTIPLQVSLVITRAEGRPRKRADYGMEAAKDGVSLALITRAR